MFVGTTLSAFFASTLVCIPVLNGYANDNQPENFQGFALFDDELFHTSGGLESEDDALSDDDIPGGLLAMI
jgi:hypothetical protein